MSYLAGPASTSNYGVVKIGNGITVANGVISVTNGGGGSTIGTWTPTIAVSTAGTITVTAATARYAKMGQQVICYFDISVATKTGGSNNNTLTLNGLPFTSVSGTGIVGSLITTYFDGLNSNQTYITGTIAGTANSVLLWDVHQAAAMTRFTYSDVQVTPIPTRLVGTITYISSS